MSASSQNGEPTGSLPSPPPRAPVAPPRVVNALIPTEVVAEREADAAMQAHADDCRGAGLPVPQEPGDTPATTILKGRLAREHLRVEESRGCHAVALEFLTDVVEGTVKGVTEEGAECDLHPRHRIAAAKAVVQAGQRAIVGAPIHVENANILAAGDVLATVDPKRLEEAVARARARVAAGASA